MTQYGEHTIYKAPAFWCVPEVGALCFLQISCYGDRSPESVN